MKRTFGTAIYHSMRTSWRYGSLGGCPLLARLPRPVRDLKVEPRDLAEVAIDNVEKIGEVGQDCQIRVLESCSSQVRSGQVRMARGRWNLTLAALHQVDDFKLPKLSHVAKITGCEVVTI